MFDVFQKYISKTTHFIDKSLLERSIKEKTLYRLLISKFVPSNHRVIRSTNIKQIEKSLVTRTNFLEFAITTGTKLEDLLTCPITQNLFKESVYDNHGHTFEKADINEYIAKYIATKGDDIKNAPCPMNRSPILFLKKNILVQRIVDSLRYGVPFPHIPLFTKAVLNSSGNTVEAQDNQKSVPNFVMQAIIDVSKNKNISLNFPLLKTDDPTFIKRNIEQTLQRYAKILQCTHIKSWDDYIKIPNLLQKMKKGEEASLVYLYLARYQIAAGNFESTISMLESYQKIANDVYVYLILVDLYYYAKDSKQAAALSMKLATNNLEYDNAIYTRILQNDPLNWPLYRTLVSLKSSPIVKAQNFM